MVHTPRTIWQTSKIINFWRLNYFSMSTKLMLKLLRGSQSPVQQCAVIRSLHCSNEFLFALSTFQRTASLPLSWCGSDTNSWRSVKTLFRYRETENVSPKKRLFSERPICVLFCILFQLSFAFSLRSLLGKGGTFAGKMLNRFASRNYGSTVWDIGPIFSCHVLFEIVFF